MGLTHHVGAVIFHYDKHMDFGIYTDEHPSYEVLSELILGDLTDKERHSFSTLIDKATHWQTTHCHLIEQKKVTHDGFKRFGTNMTTTKKVTNLKMDW